MSPTTKIFVTLFTLCGVTELVIAYLHDDINNGYLGGGLILMAAILTRFKDKEL